MIDRFTRGDTPVWFGAMDDIEQLKFLLEDLDILPASALSYFGKLVLERTSEELISIFDLAAVERSNAARNQFYESEKLGLTKEIAFRF